MNYYQNERPILLREYGRTIQELVYKCMEEPDKSIRTEKANEIIEIILRVNSSIKNVENYYQKLWDHLYYISDFKLDVDSPFPMVKPDYITPKAEERFHYPSINTKHRHYGRYIVEFIKHAVKLEEEKKSVVTQNIASYMKLVHKTWNNEVVNDEIVKNDLSIISNGGLELPQDESIKQLVANIKSNHKSKQTKRKGKSTGGFSNSNHKSKYRK